MSAPPPAPRDRSSPRTGPLAGAAAAAETPAAGEAVVGTGADLVNRAQGAVAETQARLGGEAVTDEVLAERVRSALGRVVSHPGALEVAAHGGRVTLRGPILAREVDEVLATVASGRGVTGVENRLDVHERPGAVPGLQG